METPAFLLDGYFSPANRYFEKKQAEKNDGQFAVDDLLDFPKEDEVMADAFFDNVDGVNSTDSSTVTVGDSCNSSVSGGEPQLSGNFADAQFSGELCVPFDDLAELEWLSNFVEDSFSSDELQNLQLISPTNPPPTIAAATSSSQTPRQFRPQTTPNNHPPPIFPSDVSVPGKARSKRSRAAPCNWSSRLLVLSPAASASSSSSSSSVQQLIKTTLSKKRDTDETPGRKCLHCASEKTPQWRTGPMGPKTLCNACGVRFKSGRLVPEYRPASSPTFVSARHSNSHRKVLELRRQKEMIQMQQQQQHQFLSQSSIFGVSDGGDYLIPHHQSGPDYGHVM